MFCLIRAVLLLLGIARMVTFCAAAPLDTQHQNGNSSREELSGNLSKEMASDIHEVVGGEFVEVRRLLDEIRIASIKKHGLFSDQDPTRSIDRQMIRDRLSFEDGTEASINRQVSEDLFENDILLTLPQAEQLLKEIQQSPKLRRGRRQANPATSSHWENLTIPYVFQLTQTNSFWQNSIRRAHRHIETLTCIRFRYFDGDATLRGKDFLQYFRGTGCWSQVGRTGGRQPVSIGYGCEALGIIAHETLHALGLWHEQSRTDRDGFIRINLDAIMPGTESNFEKRTPYTSDNMGQPYDLGSAMHYGSKAFSTDARTYTILTQDRAYQQTIGQRNGLSFKDTKMINIRYCSKNCEFDLDCENGGYTDPLKCNQCRCPDGYAGMYCQQIPPSTSSACRATGEVTAGQWPGSMSTAGILSRGQSCFWRILPQYANQRIELTLKRLSFPCKDACLSFLELKYKTDKVATGARLCCDVPATIYSDVGTDVLLILKTDDTLDPGFEGFEISYKAVDADSVVLPPTQRQQHPKASLFTQLLKQARARGGSGGGLKPLPPTGGKTLTTVVSKRRRIFDENAKKQWQNAAIANAEVDYSRKLLENPYLHEERPIVTTTESSTTSSAATESSSTAGTSESTATTEEVTDSTGGSSTTTTTTIVPTTPEGKAEGWSEWKRWSDCSATCGACGQKKRLRTCLAGIGKCKGFAFELERCALSACPLPMQSTRCSGRLVMPCELMQQMDFGTVLNYDTLRQQQGNVSLDGGTSSSSSSQLMLDSNIVVEEKMEAESQLEEPPSHLLQTENNAQILRRHRRQQGGIWAAHGGRGRRQQHFCEKRFSYHCPTALLTISMDFRVEKDEHQDANVANEMATSADSQYRCCAGYTAVQGSCVKKSSRP